MDSKIPNVIYEKPEKAGSKIAVFCSETTTYRVFMHNYLIIIIIASRIGWVFDIHCL